MTVLPAPVSELDLHAWADGALSSERAALVEGWLRAHPGAAEEVRHWRLQAEALRRLYPLPEPESMSPALRRSVARASAAARRPVASMPGWRVAGLAAALAFALSIGAAAALYAAKEPAEGLADRALRLHESFTHATAEPASLAGVGGAGPDLAAAGYVLRAVRSVPGGGAGYFYAGPAGTPLTLVLFSHPEDGAELSLRVRGDTALVGWQDRRGAVVLVGRGPSGLLVRVAAVVEAVLGRQSPDRAGTNPWHPDWPQPAGVIPTSHHRM